MVTLSILGCKILQDEIVWLLKNDPNIDETIIVENDNVAEFEEKLDREGIAYAGIPPKDMPHAIGKRENDSFRVIIEIFELGLHEYPKDLKSRVYEEIERIRVFSDGLLLFYGLCGNVLGDVENDFSNEEKGFIVRILRDEERIVDDCIAATVGGSSKYCELLKAHSSKPTFFFTPMYASSWNELVSQNRHYSDPEKALKMTKMLFKEVGYSRVAKVNTGLTYVKDIDKKIKEFADLFEFEIIEIEGNQEIFKKCYYSIKDELQAHTTL